MKNDSPNETEIRSALEDIYKNPFPMESKKWHVHQKLLNRAAQRISNINCTRSITTGKPMIMGILVELEQEVECVRLRESESQTALV